MMKRPFMVKALIAAGIFAAACILFLAVPADIATTDAQSSFSVEYDTDRGGSDYRAFDLARPTHELCRDACAGDANCKSYTYTKPYNNYPARCFLKNSVPNPVPYRSCCISGVKNSSFLGDNGMGPREDNMSLTGTNLSYYHRPAFETCQSDCINNNSCKGFTWIAPGTYNANDPAMCYLMSAVTGRSAARAHYSGVKGVSSQPPPPPPPGGGTFGGKWRAYGWEFIELSQSGDSVTGRYADDYGFRYPKGTLSGTVRGDQLFFSWRNMDGAVGEAYIYPFDNGRRWGIKYCVGTGCNPVASDKYSEAIRQ